MNSLLVSVVVASLTAAFTASQKVQVDQGEILLSTVPNDTVDASLVRFALISSNRATVRATLGPYQSSQTVYHNRSDAELSAHAVHSIVYRHNPQVRVVFHANQRDFRPLCITLYGHLVDSKKAPLLAKCQPVKENSACMAELIVPADWWPNAWLENGAGGSSHKSKKSKPHIELTYATSDDLNCQMGGLNSELKSDAAKESSPKHIARIPLSPVHATYEKITMKDSPVEVFLPENPLYPKNVIYAPVFVKQNVRQFVIGANIVGGLHVERLEPVAKHVWKLAIETTGNQKIRITCSRIDDSPLASMTGQAEHVFDILFRVDTDPDVLMSTEQAIEWVIDEKIQAVSQLNIQKDKVQNILVITRSRDLINTAIITGSQVSQLVKLIMISEAGQMSDVTHKASCHSSDESVLKVSPSCTSIYLDGSESRSSANVSIHVKYSGHMSESYFTVWTPETPFTISVSDEKLSHVKQWHAPPSTPHNWHRNAIPKDECKLRFQQSIVKVYTRFVSINHNSGRENYLLGKRRLVADITDMVHIRSSNSHVASFVAPNILSGVHPGKADIQVVAPTTGKILATKSLRVTAEKEVITSLNARVVSGLNLAVVSDVENTNNNRESSHSERAIYVAKVSTDEKMTSRYQEAVLDVTLRFSDGTEMPLENFSPTEYNITVETLDSNVVVVAPNQIGNTGAHPRIICVGQGSGDLLSITLETSDLCVKRGGAIQDAAVYVSCMPSNPDNYLYQDAQVPRKYSAAVTFELQPQSHKNPHYPLVNHHLNHLNGGPLQVGLYTLFGVFCMALLAFVASCSVFAVHIKNTRQQNTKDNSQDWVWLSKETLEQAVRPKNVSKFANIVVNPMGDLETSRNLGSFVCSDGFGANICQNGDLARNIGNSNNAGGNLRQESRIVLPGRARPLPSEPIDVRNNNVPADNNNDHTNIDMNHHVLGGHAARNPAVDSLSFNQIFGSGAEGTDKASPSTDSGLVQSPGSESVNEVTVRSNLLAEVEELGSARFSAGSPSAASCASGIIPAPAVVGRTGSGGGSSSSSASRSIIVNPIDELGEDELEPPPVPPHRQPGSNDTLNWRRLERQYNNNREKLAEYLDSLQESIA
ncbi:transmembrane protein 132C [Galendromus occidentalis]|uniref:Transmembrane protein 132C n=1 Tax=Galendromus occidentalis TaxID=34638 RepID=A0AAJ7L4S1_9ACAR|nr:transmembrane protein 132C [Galendromus occidentalis]